MSDADYQQESGDDDRASIDRLIGHLIETRQPNAADLGRIVGHVANAPFEPSLTRVPLHERDLRYGAYDLSAPVPSLIYHLVKRVVLEQQWQKGATVEEYMDDLRRAVAHPLARLALYRRRGGNIVATSTPTEAVIPPSRRGARALPNLLVVYAASRGTIISGYQYSSLERISIPREALWLR